MKEGDKFIDVNKVIRTKSPKLYKWLPGFVTSYLKRIVHQDEINDFIRNNNGLKNADFCDGVIQYLNIKVEVKGLENIPKEGPVILTMNHPFGGMDALALISGIRKQREDVKFIVNDILMSLTALSDLFVGVNKHGKNEKSTRQQIMDAFASDAAICIFPAGMVSRKSKGEIKDLEWKKTFITYAIKHKQPIVPIHINGELSNFFYNLSNFRKLIGIKTNFEMLYLADELFKQRGKTIVITVGKPILPSSFDLNLSEHALAQQVKNMVYELAENN